MKETLLEMSFVSLAKASLLLQAPPVGLLLLEVVPAWIQMKLCEVGLLGRILRAPVARQWNTVKHCVINHDLIQVAFLFP